MPCEQRRTAGVVVLAATTFYEVIASAIGAPPHVSLPVLLP
jgi:hypothetical protein